MTTEHMPTQILEIMRSGKQAAIATVIETWGSAPRPVGSQLAIAEDGLFFGSVSGGCVEGAVVLEAQNAIKTGQPTVLEFGVADDDAFSVGLACGGDIKILVEPIDQGDGPNLDLINALVNAETKRQPIDYRVNLKTWARSVGLFETPQDENANVFSFRFEPRLKLYVIGAVHIAQHLSPMAQMAGYDVHIIDPRDSFAAAERFDGQTVLNEWPEDVISANTFDHRTALVTLSHDPKIDLPALEMGLKSHAFYVGALGSRRTQGKRVAALRQLGYCETDIAKIHGPVGADIGARTPAEIAVSIMSQMTERLRRPETRP